MNRTYTIVALFASAFMLVSCTALKNAQQALVNLQRCEFKLAYVDRFSLMNIPLSKKGRMADFSVTDATKLAAAFAKGEMPASFRLNVAARNPNDGTGGTPQASATMTSFAWTLIIDNTTTISGDIAQPVVIPGTGEESIIPLDINLDLWKFFQDDGFDKVMNLALALGGMNGSPSRLTLRATPRIRTDFGDIQYPGQITIIDRQFTSK